jgi:hypothetical protein
MASLPSVHEVRFSSRGLRGYDLAHLFKQGADEVFVNQIRQQCPQPGEQFLHVVALGSTEFGGPNRNGDGFSKRACREFHPTFVKFARWYRDHKNTDPAQSYGLVKLSHFNQQMGRVELLVALNAAKEAADRNGGLVADKEMDLIHSGRDLQTSMSCKVAFDICAGCGNRARNRGEYCNSAMCKYGGCQDNLGMTFDDGFTLFVHNDEPYWMDISHITEGRQADRVSWASKI